MALNGMAAKLVSRFGRTVTVNGTSTQMYIHRMSKRTVDAIASLYLRQSETTAKQTIGGMVVDGTDRYLIEDSYQAPEAWQNRMLRCNSTANVARLQNGSTAANAYARLQGAPVSIANGIYVHWLDKTVGESHPLYGLLATDDAMMVCQSSVPLQADDYIWGVASVGGASDPRHYRVRAVAVEIKPGLLLVSCGVSTDQVDTSGL